MKKVYILGIAFTLLFIGCERDDICAETTPTTPRLLIEFYDATSSEDLKSVPGLTVYGEGLDDDPITGTLATLVFNATPNSLALPLLIGADDNTETTSRFIFEQETDQRLDDDDTTASNKDIISISYTSTFEYVSRACGFKSIFNITNISIESVDEQWINSIDIIETEVENENTVHVHIFH